MKKIDIIIKKLQKFLKERPIFTKECEVVYLMVEIRKILDHDSGPYKTLRFYCNWVLHKELNQERTTKLLSSIFETNIDFKRSGRENARNVKFVGTDFFKLNTFKNELKDFFQRYDCSVVLLNKNWWKFARLLLDVIKECPIHFVSNKIRKLEIIKCDDSNYRYEFSLVGSRTKLVEKLKLKKK